MSINWSIMELWSGIRMERFLPSHPTRQTPLVFVHGNFCGSWCWNNLLKYFSNRGAPCYAINYRGHWLSQGHADLGKATTEDYVADVEECLQAIGDEVILVGHSMGGIVSQKVAERNSLKALVLLDSAPNKAITEQYFRPDPGINKVIMGAFRPLPDKTVVMERNEETTKIIFFEKDKVSKETLAQTMAYLGRESADVLKSHAVTPVDPTKIECPVYVMGRRGMGNDEKPDLWHALADYYNAEGRHISDDLSHAMFMENDWQKHAGLIEKWCFGLD